MANLELGAQLPAWHWDLDVSELRDWAQGIAFRNASKLNFSLPGYTPDVQVSPTIGIVILPLCLSSPLPWYTISPQGFVEE